MQNNFPLKNQNNLQQKEIEYTKTINYVCINSSDRIVSRYPKVNQYRIDLNENFKNISSVEVVSGSLANQNSVQNFPYLILRIDGMDHLTFSNDNIKKGFALLYLKPTAGAHVLPELGVLQRNVLNYKTPLGSLNNIQLSIHKPDGSLFDFGEANGDLTVAYSNSFLLKITTIDVSREKLHTIAVY